MTGRIALPKAHGFAVGPPRCARARRKRVRGAPHQMLRAGRTAVLSGDPRPDESARSDRGPRLVVGLRQSRCVGRTECPRERGRRLKCRHGRKFALCPDAAARPRRGRLARRGVRHHDSAAHYAEGNCSVLDRVCSYDRRISCRPELRGKHARHRAAWRVRSRCVLSCSDGRHLSSAAHLDTSQPAQGISRMLYARAEGI